MNKDNKKIDTKRLEELLQLMDKATKGGKKLQ